MAQDHKDHLERLASAPDMPTPSQPPAKPAEPLITHMRLPFSGPRLQVTALEASDRAALLPFFQDMSMMRYYLPTTARPFNLLQMEKLLTDWHDGIENFVFAIRYQGKLCGLLNLDGLDWPNSHAEIGIAITDQLARGQGFASEALAIMLDYAFGELALHRIWCRIIDGNEPSIRLFEKAGFRREGRLRQQVRRSGSFRDMLVYGLLQSEWRSPFSPNQEF